MIPKRLASFKGTSRDGNSQARIIILVRLKHIIIVHLVDMVTRKNQDIFRIDAVDI